MPNPSSNARPAAARRAPRAPSRPRLLADVGGTNIRFACCDGPGLPPDRILVLPTAGFPDLRAAALAYRERLDRPPVFAGAVIAVAAPVTGRRIRLTNTDFVVDADALSAGLGALQPARAPRAVAAPPVRLMNDFEALAWSLPILPDADLVPIGEAEPSRRSTMAVVGPGTGLGCAGLLRHGDHWHPVPGEGGHMTLAAQTALEADVIGVVRREFPHVSAERLLSGIGLPTLYRALALVQGIVPDADVRSAGDVTRGLDGSGGTADPLRIDTVAMFGALLGGFSGNVALVFGATGGLLVGGGIAPRIAARIAASPFRERFVGKGRFEGYLSRIGTAIIARPDPALDGLANAAFADRTGGPAGRGASRAARPQGATKKPAT